MQLQASMANRPAEKPNGQSQGSCEIRSLARSHTRTAIRVLVGIMRCKDATPAARVSAANAILDRGWGKATQPLESAVDGALELIQRIERVIVYFAKRGFENVARIMKRRLALKPRMSEPLLSRRSPNNRSFGKARSMPWS
jgi:hypothetical protein